MPLVSTSIQVQCYEDGQLLFQQWESQAIDAILNNYTAHLGISTKELSLSLCPPS